MGNAVLEAALKDTTRQHDTLGAYVMLLAAAARRVRPYIIDLLINSDNFDFNFLCIRQAANPATRGAHQSWSTGIQ